MTKRLTMLKINTLGSVDVPANQHGRALLMKRANEPETVEKATLMAELRKFASKLVSLGKGAGAEDLNSAMREAETRELLWDLNYALSDSVFSIFADDAVADKKSAVGLSLEQYLGQLEVEGAFEDPAMVQQFGKKFADQIKVLVETDAIAKGDTICPTCGIKMADSKCPDCGYVASAKPPVTKKEEGEPVMSDAVVTTSLEDLMKSANLTPEVKAFLKSQSDANAALQKSLEDSTKAIELEKSARLDREYLSKAVGFGSLAQKPEEFGPILKGLATKAPEEFAQLEPMLKAWNEALQQSGLFTEIGKGGGNVDGAGSASAEIEAKALELMKSQSGLTKEAAVSKVLTLHSDLYKRYQEELWAEGQ